MKIQMLVIAVVGLSLTYTTWANDLPSLGYSPGIPVKDLVAKNASLGGGFDRVSERYVDGWDQYLRSLRDPPVSLETKDQRKLYAVSAMVLAASEDAQFIRLAFDIAAGRLLEQPAIAARRYLQPRYGDPAH